MRRSIVPVALVLTILSPPGHAQDNAAELSRLKRENQRLQAKLKAAELNIERLEKELAAFKSNPDGPDGPANDLFATGKTWNGKRNYWNSSDFQDWKLFVLERSGNKFKGEIVFRAMDGANQTIPVSGTAPTSASGKVEFRTEQKGLLRQLFRGDLRGGRINLVFSGTGLRGNRVEGTAYLSE